MCVGYVGPDDHNEPIVSIEFLEAFEGIGTHETKGAQGSVFRVQGAKRTIQDLGYKV